jgi:putative transposase
VEHVREKYEVSERHACRLLGQWRRTQRYAAIQSIDEDALTEAIIVLASESRSLRIPANYGAVAT